MDLLNPVLRTVRETQPREMLLLGHVFRGGEPSLFLADLAWSFQSRTTE